MATSVEVTINCIDYNGCNLVFQIKLLFFAKCRELAGNITEDIIIVQSNITGIALLNTIVTKYPGYD